MPIENERKYKLDMEPDIFKNRLINMGVHHTVKLINQVYLVRDKERGFVERIREEKELGFITYINNKKIGFGESVREVENEISADSYNELAKYFSIGIPIIKYRYTIPMPNGTEWEVDIYQAEHSGLIIAEMELPTPDTEIVFHPVLGKKDSIIDVSKDKTYKNWYLAGI